ncbi:GMC family oxidoreductase [Shewanella sedimentimangrovi]|uniref:GMC family oxidoreductase n=1 Tax=Shewanella sedimentimangrovi TaxID=2814293 RepID=A0ABX7R043_9GAMM|nr:GMC family oxidoreductase [Shewanella sedimentimangrovi]QSX36551.1 GMC family oxidoreductase [Shewanella sedimentimangrovi]
MNFITPEQAASREYDLVIVGGGISGALVAKQLTKAGKRCLIVEAGTGGGASYQGYLDFLATYHQATVKIPNAPYPVNPNAPEPLVTDTRRISEAQPDETGYFVQMGPLPFSSSYTTYLGGTTLHWLGTSLRMLPEDFKLKALYGNNPDCTTEYRDWPIEYRDLEPWYRAAERELGVSAEVAEQTYLGVEFPPGYVYPMHALPKSWSDKYLARHVDGMQVQEDGKGYRLRVRGTPASRNSVPNQDYDGGLGYQPRGAVGNEAVGQRCMGNTSCVPICPIQAKYNALKTLSSADGERLDIVLQSVASKLIIDDASQEVTAVRFKHYASPDVPQFQEYEVRGKRYVLAAHAVANAVLLMASDACPGNPALGRHLMDHPELLTWGKAKEPLWPLRGPLATSGIEDLRAGSFRRNRAAFRMEMGNDGWLWPTGAPVSDVQTLVDEEQLYGPQLRQQLQTEVSRQFRFGILVEQLGEYDNRVSIDPAYVDAIGNYRPIIHYDLSPYTRNGFSRAYETAQAIFERAGIENASLYKPSDAGYFQWRNQALTFNGAGHFAGTHCMGDDPQNSVVNPKQRTWAHPNLYLVGCGNMVSMGTSNPTLTMSALTLWAAQNILDDLNGVTNAAP